MYSSDAMLTSFVIKERTGTIPGDPSSVVAARTISPNWSQPGNNDMSNGCKSSVGAAGKVSPN